MRQARRRGGLLEVEQREDVGRPCGTDHRSKIVQESRP
jgi:hypothetical protein